MSRNYGNVSPPNSPQPNDNDTTLDFLSEVLPSKKSKAEGKEVNKRFKQQNYEYQPLSEILNYYPIKDNKFVSIYAIIRYHDAEKGTISIMDETRKCFNFYVNNMLDPKNPTSSRLPMRPGDIIRIHRLCLFNDYTQRCPHVRNIVIFEAFKEKKFVPIYLSKNPTLTDYDKERVASLLEWNNRNLLSRKVIKTSCKIYFICDTVFQVLCTVKLEKRIILVCWNGYPFKEYPCAQLIKVEQILDTLKRCRSQHVYTEEFIRKIYNENKIIFISVYGMHRMVASTLKPLDIIIIYNLLIKSDKFYFDMFSFLLYDGYIYGRTIRVPEYNSEIAISLREQIENYYFLDGNVEYQSEDLDHSPSHILSPSKIFDSDTEDDENDAGNRKRFKNNKPENQKEQNDSFLNTFTETLNESSLNNLDFSNQIVCTHLNFTSVEKMIIYKHFFANTNKSVQNAISLRAFKEILELPEQQENQLFKIQAKFHSFVFSKSSLNLFNSIDSLRKYATIVECTSASKSRICEYRESFDNFLKSTKYYRLENDKLVMTRALFEDELQVASSSSSFNSKRLDRLKCPRCSLMSCIIGLDFSIILQDYDNTLFLTRLSGVHANLLFSASTADLCSNSSDICQKIPVIFKYMSHITNDNSPCSHKISWTISCKNDPICAEKEFKIVDAHIISNMVSCGIMTTKSIFR